MVNKVSNFELEKELNQLLSEILREGKVDIFGDIRIRVDSKSKHLGFIKGSEITLHPKVSKYPREVKKYIIAHELAHIAVPKHTKRFYMILDIIYPKHREIRKKWRLT